MNPYDVLFARGTDDSCGDAGRSGRGRLTLRAFGMYVAYNRWWSDRVTGNLLFSPVPRVDLGLELLWGQRENKDGETGKAKQIQFAWIYRY